MLGVFTDIYRTIHALGFEDASNFDSIVSVVKAASGASERVHHHRTTSNLFLDGLGTGP